MLLSEQAYRKIERELAKFPDDQRQSAIDQRFHGGLVLKRLHLGFLAARAAA